MTEPQIMEGCRRRDRAAQRALYDLTSERVYRVVARILRNPEDAADVMQDTYIRVFDRVEQFQAKASLGTWVYRVAVNEALQFLRKHRRREQLNRAHAPGFAETAESGGQLQIDMQDALDQLPDEDRTLLVLKYYEGMNYAEMAAVLEKPAGTIASGLNRARHTLRHVLEGGSDAAPPLEEITELPHLKK